MGAAAPIHPTNQALQSYGLGKLDDTTAESVERHLKSCSDCRRRVAEMTPGTFLGRLRAAERRAAPSAPNVSSDSWLSMLGASASSTTPPPADSSPPGLAEHPDYEVIRELGQGGMGTVYLAQNRLMGRYEVLKVVSSHLIKRRGVLERFLGEIRNAARLHHPNIVTAYAATRVGESLVFAMEYVDGRDLAELVKAKGPLTVPHSCNYVYQAALGLQHAHEQGMVHRDIKPSNLILSPQGNRAMIKILDFGLAKIQSEGPIDGGLTHDGQMLGTPDFIAPEQIGNARRADIRADIYSLGCTLYYLLTGGPPFKATSLYEILQAHHSMDALPLNLARPEVPVELAALVARMMAKDPERRFQAPHEVAHALRTFFKPAGARPAVFNAELSCPGAQAPVAELSVTAGASAPPSVTHMPDPLAAPQPATQRPGDGSVWDGLIDLGAPGPLTEAPTATVAAKRRTSWPSWPVLIALSISAVTALGAVVVFATRNNDFSPSTLPAPENKRSQFEKSKSPVGAFKDSDDRPVEADPRPGSAIPAGEPEHAEFSPPKAMDKSSTDRAGAVRPSRLPDPPVTSVSQNSADTPNQPRQKPDWKLKAELRATVATDLSPEARLKEFGLIRDGKIFVLGQEADLVQKFNTARPLVEEHRFNAENKFTIEQARARLHELELIFAELDFQISDRNRQLGQRPPRPDSDQQAFFDGIKNDRDILDRQRSEFIKESKILRSQFPNPRQIQELDVAIARDRVSCRTAVADLGAIIQAIEVRFADLKKDDQVRSALQKLGNPKFVHRPEYQKIATQVKQWQAFMKLATQTMELSTERVPKKKNAGVKKR
jgi:serine/threonine protein kinase